MTTIISTHSFRGGTGKSNISANLAVQLANRGSRVAVFDTDIQSPGIHVIFNLEESTIRYTLNDYLWGKCKIEEAAYPVYEAPDSKGIVYLVPSSIKPNDIARILRDRYEPSQMQAAFANIMAAYNLDYVIVDTHPGLNEETLLSIAVSDVLIIVLRPDQQDFQGTGVTVDVARRLRVPKIFLIVNKMPPEYDFADVRAKVEQTYSCSVGTLLPLSFDVAQNASSSVFSLQFPDHPFSQGINEAVEAVIT